MTRLILILPSLLLFISGSTRKVELDGVWILAYSLANDSPEPVYVRTLMDFKNDSLTTISIGDFGTGDLSQIHIEKSQFKFKKNESVITFAGGQFKISYSVDSLILQPESETKLVFKRLDPRLRTKEPRNKCFKGAYIIGDEKYQNSIYFINDSTLIYTGDTDIDSPAKRWNIVTYKGFQLFNIQDIFVPLTVIKSCTPDNITLMYYRKKEPELVMKATETLIPKEKLIGRWIELRSDLKPPPAPHFKEEDQYYDLTLDQDSVQIKFRGRNKKLKWDITTDGKRIYFKDQIFKEEGSWKLLFLTDSAMTLRIGEDNGFEEEIVKLKRESNGR